VTSGIQSLDTGT